MRSPAVAEGGGEARGGGRGESGKRRDVLEVDVGVDDAKKEIKVKRMCGQRHTLSEV